MKLRNIFMVLLGFIALALGSIGVVFPVLPTTPFVLLAAACFSIGNPKLREWLKRNKFFGSYIENYQNKTGVPLKIVRKSIITIWVGLTISMILVGKIWLILMLFVIGVCVSLYLKTLIRRPDINGSDEWIDVKND